MNVSTHEPTESECSEDRAWKDPPSGQEGRRASKIAEFKIDEAFQTVRLDRGRPSPKYWGS
jgi:hypothetical protein